MTAVIYARYSSDSQREASIEGQLRDCKDYAEKNGITVVGTYIDRAYSAKTDDRPDFQRMIKDSGKKIFDVVLVWKLDRFARNRFDAVNYKYQLEKNGVHLVSAMEPISQGPEGIMVESMLIGMAEYYSAELALKVARGERENALQCKYNGGVVPLGFTIGKEDRLYHIDPETAPIVQEIFTRYADGEPAEKIAASLNERGLRTRTGKPFVKNSFFQIFRNRRYIGEYRYKDIVTPGGIPAIVDQDLFDRVQQRFEQNRIAHGRPAKEDVSYLLTTKLFCGKCGTLMGGESGTSHMGNTYYYYKCGNAKRHGKAHCDLKAIRKEPLERFVVDTAIKVIFSDEIIERLIDLVMEAQQKENTRLPVLKEQLRDTEKRLANLLEAIEQGILTPTTKQRLDELEAQKEALNTSILEEELKLSCTNVMLQCLDGESRCIFILGTMFRLDSAVAGEILGISPAAYRKRLSRIREKMAAFLGEYCGLAGGKCSCRRRVDYAIASRRLTPERLEYNGMEQGRSRIAEQCRAIMEEIDGQSRIFAEMPFYRTGPEAKEFIKGLLRSDAYRTVMMS